MEYNVLAATLRCQFHGPILAFSGGCEHSVVILQCQFILVVQFERPPAAEIYMRELLSR